MAVSEQDLNSALRGLIELQGGKDVVGKTVVLRDQPSAKKENSINARTARMHRPTTNQNGDIIMLDQKYLLDSSVSYSGYSPSLGRREKPRTLFIRPSVEPRIAEPVMGRDQSRAPFQLPTFRGETRLRHTHVAVAAIPVFDPRTKTIEDQLVGVLNNNHFDEQWGLAPKLPEPTRIRTRKPRAPHKAA